LVLHLSAAVTVVP